MNMRKSVQILNYIFLWGCDCCADIILIDWYVKKISNLDSASHVNMRRTNLNMPSLKE
jgi:hypothetical protein